MLRMNRLISNRVEILLLLLVLFMWFTSNLAGSFFIDEMTYSTVGLDYLKLKDIRQNAIHPPLGKYFLGLGQVALGRGSFGARFPSVLFSLGSIYLVYLVGVKFTDRLMGFLAALVLVSIRFFDERSVTAMLDMPLVFFTLLLLYLLMEYGRERNTKKDRIVFLSGLASASAFLTKYYSIAYVFVALSYIVLINRHSARSPLRLVLGFSLGFILMSSLIMAPFIFTFQPVVQPALKPYLSKLPTVFFLIKDALVTSRWQLGIGSSVLIGNTAYEHPPAWAYVYWLKEYCGIGMLIGIMSSIAISIYFFKKKRAYPLNLLLSYSILPLAFLSFMTVKFPRYILPIMPLSILLISTSLYLFFQDKKCRQLSYAAVVLLFIVPSAPVYSLVKNSSINMDTGYAEAAERFTILAWENPSKNITVMARHSWNLEYYLGAKKPANLIVFDLSSYVNCFNLSHYPENYSLQLLLNKRIDYILGIQERFSLIDAETCLYITENFYAREQVKDDLYIFSPRE